MGILRAFVESEINILQLRKNESLTPDMKEVLDLLTLDPKKPPKIVGSFKYKVHEYPADIDLYEPVHGCCTVDSTKRKIVGAIKDMAKRIKARRFTYLGDFKAGVDDRYYIDIGTYDPEKKILKGYDQYRIVDAIANLYTRELLSKEEAIELISLVVKRPRSNEHQKLKEAIRQRYVVRWAIDELIKGYKMLPQGKKLYLSAALSHGTVVKADLWALIDDRFMEVTNWFMIVSNDSEGNSVYLSEKPDMYQSSLKRDIMLLKSPELKKHMKLAKRMWLYAISNNDSYTVHQLYPLFSSPIAKLYQIQSEIEILTSMLLKLKSPPLFLIEKQIALFKTRIGSVPDVYIGEDDEKKVLGYFDAAIKEAKAKNAEDTAKHLDSAFVLIRDIVDAEAKKYLKKNIPHNKLLKLLLKAAK